MIRSYYYLLRSFDEVRKIKPKPKENKITSKEELVKLEPSENSFFIRPSHFPDSNIEYSKRINEPNLAWICVKDSITSDGTKGYRLQLDDVVKIGRIKLRLKEIHYSTKKRNSTYNKSNKEIINVEYTGNYTYNENLYQDKKKRKKPTCRICYCTEEELCSDLIQPCQCSGSMRYIHYACLQQWLKSKGIDKKATTANSISYSLKAIECELCKYVLPEVIKQNGKSYNIFDFIKPDFESYLIFEYIPTEQSQTKSFYSVNITNKDKIKIGRGQDADMRIADISVSRSHAYIYLNINQSYIHILDNQSKFGSLVFTYNPKIQLILNKPLSIQVGRTVLFFRLTKRCSLFSCFSSSKKIKEENTIGYQEQNYSCVFKSEVVNVKEIKQYDNIEDTESSCTNISNNQKSNIYDLNPNINKNKDIELSRRDEVIQIGLSDKSGLAVREANETEEKYEKDDVVLNELIQLEDKELEEEKKSHTEAKLEKSVDIGNKEKTNKEENEDLHLKNKINNSLTEKQVNEREITHNQIKKIKTDPIFTEKNNLSYN